MDWKPSKCFPFKRESDEEWFQRLEQERREGRSLLREMVVKSDDLDWQKVIKKAEELHRKQEQKIMKKKRKALRERRKVDAIGSFSVNLLTMRVSEEDNLVLERWRKRVQNAGDSFPTTGDSCSRTMDLNTIQQDDHVGNLYFIERRDEQECNSVKNFQKNIK